MEIFRNFLNTFKKFGPQTVDCKHATLVKMEVFKISRVTFWKIPMCMVEFSTELQNAETSPVTLQKADFTKDTQNAHWKHLWWSQVSI